MIAHVRMANASTGHAVQSPHGFCTSGRGDAYDVLRKQKSPSSPTRQGRAVSNLWTFTTGASHGDDVSSADNKVHNIHRPQPAQLHTPSYCQELCTQGSRGVLCHPEPVLKGPPRHVASPLLECVALFT